MRGNDSRKMRGHSGCTDDHPVSIRFRILCKFGGGIRRAMRGDDPRGESDSEAIEYIERSFQRDQIAFAPHNDRDIRHGEILSVEKKRAAIHGAPKFMTSKQFNRLPGGNFSFSLRRFPVWRLP